MIIFNATKVKLNKTTILKSVIVVIFAIGMGLFIPIFSGTTEDELVSQSLPEKDTDLMEITENFLFTDGGQGDTININKNKLNEVKEKDEVVEEQQQEYIKKLEMEITAYTAGYESTGKTPDHPAYGITASGAYVQENHTIACGSDYPFGTEIYIPYFDNVYTCEDRGGAITNRHIDVYIEDLDEALKFGRRTLKVKILEWGDW